MNTANSISLNKTNDRMNICLFILTLLIWSSMAIFLAAHAVNSKKLNRIITYELPSQALKVWSEFQNFEFQVSANIQQVFSELNKSNSLTNNPGRLSTANTPYSANKRLEPVNHHLWNNPVTMDLRYDRPAPLNEPNYPLALNDSKNFEQISNSISAYIRYFKPRAEQGKGHFFLKHTQNRLPGYKKLFKKAADQNDLDWRLVASIAYQESLWDPAAISPTGVKGIMMLTKKTAKEMGVEDRTDPAESIYGGAAYFKKIHKRLPVDVQEPDRTLMALAAYNAGYGHLTDARKITQKLGDNDAKWTDVKKHLPRLQDPRFYNKTRYGYSTGARQAIHYVGEIQYYYELLLLSTEGATHPKKAIAQSPKLKKAFQIAMH